MSDRSEGYSDGYAAGLRWGKRDGDRIAAETLRELHRAQAERDQAREECGYEKRMRAFGSEELERFIDLKMRAETDRDRLAGTVKRVKALVADWQAHGDNAMKSAIARQGMSDEQELRRYAGLMWQRSRDLTAAIEGTDS